VVKNADLIITHDTGMMHIAAGLKKRIISVWGNTVPEFGMTPYYPDNEGSSTIIEVENLSCRPCSKIGYADCPKGHFKCMQMINEEEILEQL
jgi:ADP-heptose:LPS heptosyltransferase